METNFKFHLPLEVLEKATDANGREIMKIGGIASTAEKDADGEYLDPKGFDLSYFKNQGFFNWHHMSKKDPNAIIGEPTGAKITPEGLYVEGFLYSDSELAKSVYDTAKMLEKSSNNRRLGFSIEGKATKRRNDDEKHADFKYVEKAAITGCAITFMPKNPKTYMDLIKGGVDDDYKEDEEDDDEVKKMLEAGSTTGRDTTNSTTSSGAPLKTESSAPLKSVVSADGEYSPANGGKNEILSKSHLVKYTFDKIPGISFKTAEQIGDFIIKSFDMNAEKLNLTEETVDAVLTKLDKAVDVISKAKTDDDAKDDKGSDDDSDEDDLKGKANELAAKLKKSGESKSSAMAKMIKKGYSADLSKAVCNTNFSDTETATDEGNDLKKAISEISELKKGLEGISALITDKNHSVGVILKHIYESTTAVNNRVEALEKGLESGALSKAQTNDLEKGGSSEELTKAISIFSGISERIGKFEQTFTEKLGTLEKAMNQPNPRKSITSVPVERNFNDGTDLTKGQGGNQISKANRGAVLEILDKVTFEKGYDPEYADAMVKFESGVDIPASVQKRLATEKNILFV